MIDFIHRSNRTSWLGTARELPAIPHPSTWCSASQGSHHSLGISLYATIETHVRTGAKGDLL